ncbi:MAG: YHS domain-containing protein [Woeseiaceae bacterium]
MRPKKKVRDPVCIMDVDVGQLAFVYMDIEYSFCSQQCQDRFSANPHLYIGQPGKPSPKQHGESIIRRRVLKLDVSVPADVETKIDAALREMMGIKEVTIDKNIIRITYDLLEATTAQIETTIQLAGEKLAASWGEKLKRAFIHYLEESELDNLEQQQSSHGHHHH